MDTNDEGRVIIDGVRTSLNTQLKNWTTYRREDVGFVVPILQLSFKPYGQGKRRTSIRNQYQLKMLLKHLVEVGLGRPFRQLPSQLSGEQQRPLHAPLPKNPKASFCDEPNRALDYQTGKQILTLLQEMARKQGTTVIIVTHNASPSPICPDRVIPNARCQD